MIRGGCTRRTGGRSRPAGTGRGCWCARTPRTRIRPTIIQNVPDAPSPRRIAQPMVRQGWLERGPGATRERGREPLYGLVGAGAGPGGGRAGAGAEEHGNAGDLRGIVRLGERRTVPQRPGPAPPPAEPDRRVHGFGAHLQRRGVRRDPAARLRPDEPCQDGRQLAEHRRADRVDRGVRRDGDQERGCRVGRAGAARGAAVAGGGLRTRCTVRAGQPAPRTTCQGRWTPSGCRSGRTPTQR